MAIIIKKRFLNTQVVLMDVFAPLISKKAMPGQFIMLRVSESGERIPLTIADFDSKNETITIIFQVVGKTTWSLSCLKEGEDILDFAGPLGKPSVFTHKKKVAVIAGGLGTAICYPQAKSLFKIGTFVHVICGFRNKDLIILEDELKENSNKLSIITDDGSNGTKGFVTDVLNAQLNAGEKFDLVIAIGPLVMMKAVSELTRKFKIETIVSMNPIMIDGTGMCGGCRITVDNKTKYACVDGPDFNGHLVDFDEAIRRANMYRPQEKYSFDNHKCMLGGENGA